MRRRSDVAEAWIGLATAAAVTMMAPLAGVVAAGHTEAALRHQAQGRHAWHAVLTQDAAAVYTADSSGVAIGHTWAAVRWKGPDGALHTGRAEVAVGQRAGSSTVVWTNDRGRITPRPPGRTAAAVESGITGAGVAGGACLVLLLGRRAAQACLDRSRERQWEDEWAVIEPRWSHRGA